MKAYYFSKEDKKLRHGDGRDIAIGVTHTVEGELELCGNGLHASKNVLDALSYAPGTHLWIVELSGDILHGEDKCCSRERTYIQHTEATDLLRVFARKCAIDVAHLWDDPDIVARFLQTGFENLEGDVLDAAFDAAWSSARAVAWAAARATGDSCGASAWAAAGAAAWAAARKKQRVRLSRMVNKALRGAGNE